MDGGGAVKYSEFRRWLVRQGVEFVRSSGSHWLIRYGGRSSVFPDHGSKEIKEPLRKKIIKDLGL
jgi:mRNA interferase HicA